jgi:UDP-N-acetyl-D-glucosamine dehydrogenase
MENVFRAVNIALVNELKIIFDRMDIDIWEALDAAETKPFGFMRFNPGPGWGGHCIPLDPFYLAWKARESGVPTKFIELAGEINTRMPDYVIEKLQLALNERSKTLNGARILVLGLAYKRDIDDPRESPAFELIHRLLTLGADVAYHDPHIPKAPSMRSWPDLPPMTSQPLTQENLQSIDAVLLATDHQDVDYDLVLEHAPLIIDTRGVFRDHEVNVEQA